MISPNIVTGRGMMRSMIASGTRLLPSPPTLCSGGKSQGSKPSLFSPERDKRIATGRMMLIGLSEMTVHEDAGAQIHSYERGGASHSPMRRMLCASPRRASQRMYTKEKGSWSPHVGYTKPETSNKPSKRSEVRKASFILFFIIPSLRLVLGRVVQPEAGAQDGSTSTQPCSVIAKP